MNKIEFQREVNKLFPFLKENFFNQIEEYKCFLQLMNQEFNLTNLDKEEDVYGKYFYESLVPYAKFEIFDDSKHMLFEEEHEKFTKVLKAFIEH